MANFQNEREQLAQWEELFRQNKFAEGLAQADAVLQQFPASFQLRFLKFKFLLALKKNDEASQLLRQMHGMFGDNILILKELADLNFQEQKYPESLLYYRKLLFLDSFNTAAQERVRQLQGLLEADVTAKLADTQIELHYEDSAPGVASAPAADSSPPPQITFAGESEEAPLAAAKEATPPAEGPPFETESAAELYFKQGLYRESLAIYKNLFEKTGRTDFFMKIKAILLLLRTEKSNQVIEQLQRFLQLIQQRGSQIV